MDYILDLDVLFDENRCCLVHEARRVCVTPNLGLFHSV